MKQDEGLRAVEHRPLVLLIDDDTAVLESLQGVFACEGIHVVTAADARDGLERLRDAKPDLVITDLCMAGITGWDVLFHERMERPDLPVFVITALPPNETGGASQFATAFFQKPLDLDALIAAVRRQLAMGGPDTVIRST